jgi:hypothetical protein
MTRTLPLRASDLFMFSAWAAARRALGRRFTIRSVIASVICSGVVHMKRNVLVLGARAGAYFTLVNKT